MGLPLFLPAHTHRLSVEIHLYCHVMAQIAIHRLRRREGLHAKAHSVHNACVQRANACVQFAQCVRAACTMRACSLHNACVQRAQCVRAVCTMRACIVQRAHCVRAVCTMRACSVQRAQCVRAVCTVRGVKWLQAMLEFPVK